LCVEELLLIGGLFEKWSAFFSIYYMVQLLKSFSF